MTILVVGDANADLSAIVSRFPHEGDDSPVATLGWGSGGSAANVAAALALLGTHARLLARVGRDPAAEVALRAAHTADVDLSAVQRDDALATGLCFAAISPGGERTFFSFRGANVGLNLSVDTRTVLKDVSWLHIAGHALLEGSQRTTARLLIEEANCCAVPVSLDLCLPLVRAGRDELLGLMPHLHIIFANEPELAALFPHLPPEAALEQIIGYKVYLAVLKRGPHSCLITSSDMRSAAPAFPVEAVDTNGCGDAFVAGFLHAHLHGAAPQICAALANAMGALTATRPGAAEALPTPVELQAFLVGRTDDAAITRLVGEHALHVDGFRCVADPKEPG